MCFSQNLIYRIEIEKTKYHNNSVVDIRYIVTSASVMGLCKSKPTAEDVVIPDDIQNDKPIRSSPIGVAAAAASEGVEEIENYNILPTALEEEEAVEEEPKVEEEEEPLSTEVLLDQLEEVAFQTTNLTDVASSSLFQTFQSQFKQGNVQDLDMSYLLLCLSNHCEDETSSINLRGVVGKTKALTKKIIIKLAKEILSVKVKGGNFVNAGKVIITPAIELVELIRTLRKGCKVHSKVKEGNGVGMLFCSKQKFENWAHTIQTKKKILTFCPQTKVGLCNLVAWAKSQKKSVRVAGYRHSWSDITVNDGQILVSFLPREDEDNDEDQDNDLQGIELLDEGVEEEGVQKKLCRIGAATSNEQFRQWVIDNSLSKDENGDTVWKPWWTLPLNTILVEVTFGGSTSAICHGAGKGTTTLSDLVMAVEFVNANGELQVVNDPSQLKSASGCFGMLGIVTSVTMKLDPLTFAKMSPKKKPLPLTIPPPKDFEIPCT